ncbi:MAG: DUF4298 domain-containing protein [Aerococcaceae bacterium]|nr:DUF4298 domain-containing protein [Aerococcaceae bacterium]
MTEQIQRIETMEQHLNRAQAAILQLEKALEQFVAVQQDVQALSYYYGSDDWYQDRESDEKSALPTTLRRGVLSEDLIYNLLTEYRTLNFQLIETATAILKES